MKPAFVILVVTLTGAPLMLPAAWGQAGGAVEQQPLALAGLGPQAPEEESRTKPVSAPLPKESMNLGAIPYKIIYCTYCRTQGRKNWELYIINADGSGQAI